MHVTGEHLLRCLADSAVFGQPARFVYRRDMDTDLLTVKVLDEDRIGSDDLIGTCRIGVAALADGEPRDLSLLVRGSNEHSRLHLTASFVPLTGAPCSPYARLPREALRSSNKQMQMMDTHRGSCFICRDQRGFLYNAIPGELAAEVACAEMGPAPEGSPLTRMPDAWRKLAAVAGHTAEDLFDPVAFVENLDTDTQARQSSNIWQNISTRASLPCMLSMFHLSVVMQASFAELNSRNPHAGHFYRLPPTGAQPCPLKPFHDHSSPQGPIDMPTAAGVGFRQQPQKMRRGRLPRDGAGQMEGLLDGHARQPYVVQRGARAGLAGTAARRHRRGACHSRTCHAFALLPALPAAMGLGQSGSESGWSAFGQNMYGADCAAHGTPLQPAKRASSGTLQVWVIKWLVAVQDPRKVVTALSSGVVSSVSALTAQVELLTTCRTEQSFPAHN